MCTSICICICGCGAIEQQATHAQIAPFVGFLGLLVVCMHQLCVGCGVARIAFARKLPRCHGARIRRRRFRGVRSSQTLPPVQSVPVCERGRQLASAHKLCTNPFEHTSIVKHSPICRCIQHRTNEQPTYIVIWCIFLLTHKSKWRKNISQFTTRNTFYCGVCDIVLSQQYYSRVYCCLGAYTQLPQINSSIYLYVYKYQHQTTQHHRIIESNS